MPKRPSVRGGPGPNRIMSRIDLAMRPPTPQSLDWWLQHHSHHSGKAKHAKAASNALAPGTPGIAMLPGSHPVITASAVGTPVDASASTAITPTIPGASNASTLLVAFVFSRVSNVTYTVSGGGAWTSVQEGTGANGPTISIWKALGTETTNPTFTPSISANVTAGVVIRFANVSFDSPVDVSGTLLNVAGSVQDIVNIPAPVMNLTDGLRVACGAMRSGDATAAVLLTADGLTWTNQKLYATLTGSDMTFDIQTAPFTNGPVACSAVTLDLNGTAAVGSAGWQFILRPV